MNLFSLGRIEELLVIMVVMLILFGPDQLPEMAARLGRFMRAFQRYSSQITGEFQEVMRDLEREHNESKGDWKAVGEGLRESATSVHQDLRGAIGDARAAFQQRGPGVNGPQAGAPPK